MAFCSRCTFTSAASIATGFQFSIPSQILPQRVCSRHTLATRRRSQTYSAHPSGTSIDGHNRNYGNRRFKPSVTKANATSELNPNAIQIPLSRLQRACSQRIPATHRRLPNSSTPKSEASGDGRNRSYGRRYWKPLVTTANATLASNPDGVK